LLAALLIAGCEEEGNGESISHSNSNVQYVLPNSAEVSDNAKENSTHFNKPHSFLLPYEAKTNDNTTKSESVTFGLVTGICSSIDKPLAVINNKMVVYEGDTIDDITIVKIYKEKVEFIKNDKNYVKEIIRFP
jgi:hypothetical protein